MEGLSGGFVYGAGGSGLITPRMGLSPVQSGANTPALSGMRRGGGGGGGTGGMGEMDQQSFNAAFGQGMQHEGMAVKAMEG
jgi:hypothetical protein